MFNLKVVPFIWRHVDRERRGEKIREAMLSPAKKRRAAPILPQNGEQNTPPPKQKGYMWGSIQQMDLNLWFRDGGALGWGLIFACFVLEARDFLNGVALGLWKKAAPARARVP
ncbi:hypothetical protein B0H10DRAFT_1940982 [Mycena sp. CBHHK59/15]|nr:hypothetical protein B0H10DRAFT_1940982 [Mycena sp. CBHHK59/15]